MNFSRLKNRAIFSPLVLLILIILIWTGLWLIYPHEFVASDPWNYSELAFHIKQGTFFDSPPSSVFAHRLSVILPTAFLYELLGVNILSTNLWPLFASLIIIVTVYAALPTRRSKALGVIMAAGSVTLFGQSTALLPDIISASFMALSALFLFYRQISLRSRFWWLFPTLATLSLFISFIAKMSAYWVLPLWIYAFLVDQKSKELRSSLIRRFYLPAFVAGMILGLAYLLFSYQVWGDPFTRFTSIQQLTSNHRWAWQGASLFDWIKRLTYYPTGLFLRDYGFILVFAIFAVPLVSSKYRFWVYYTLFTILFFWLGSTSFTSYQPMPVSTRMAIPCLPGLYILAGYFASKISISSSKSQRVNNLIAFLVIVFISGLPFLYYMYSWREKTTPEANVMRIVNNEVLDKSEASFLLLTSDTRSPRSLAFYFGYEYPMNLDVAYAGDKIEHPIGVYDKVFIFLHEIRSTFLKSAYGFENCDDVIKSSGLSLTYEEHGVSLFESLAPHDLLSKQISSNPSCK